MIGRVEIQQERAAAEGEYDGLVIAYNLLLEMRRKAMRSRVDPREMPATYSFLRAWLMTEEVLRWMLYQGHIEHVLQVAGSGAETGTTDAATARFGENSGLVLTTVGEGFAELIVKRDNEATRKCVPALEAWAMLRMGRLVPRYDPEERRFSWGVHTLKVFRQPAGNQELILQTAEELSWPEWFDDPLGRGGPGNSKKRLHDTLQDLNRRQQPYLIHFKGDGTGTRVGWELR